MNHYEGTYLVIVNPNAGGKLGLMHWSQIKSYLLEAGFQFDTIFTKRRKHAMVITRNYISKGYRQLIVVGGDGTINEVVNGMMANQEVLPELQLGVIMIGTGNDWGKTFNIPTDYQQAIDLIKRKKIFKQDVGKATFFLGKRNYTRYFINAAGLGFDSRVVELVNKAKDKGRSSKFSYLTTLFKTLIKYKPLDINIQIEGKPLSGNKLFTMCVGIGRYSGGGMQQTPNAIADDGLFDIMIVNEIKKGKIIRKIKKLYDGGINSLREVVSHRASNLKIASKDMVMLQVDGESLGHGPFEFEMADKKINIIVG